MLAQGVAYRDAHHDAQSAQLAKLVSSYGPLIDERRRVCLEHDEVAERVEELNRRLAAVEDQLAQENVLGRVKQWLGVAKAAELEHECEGLRRALSLGANRLADLVARERAIAAQLDEVEAARAELTLLRKTRGRALRDSESPLGYELRRLDEELTAHDARIRSLDKAFVAADRVARVLGDIGELTKLAARTPSLLERAARVQAALSFERLGPSDRELARGRLREHLVFARSELRAFMNAFEALHRPAEISTKLALLQLGILVAAPISDPPERSELAHSLDAAVGCAARLARAVNGDLAAMHLRRSALVDQQRALEVRSG